MILTKAAALKTDVEKIAYIFGEVKNTMKWDGADRWYTVDGTAKAWEKKSEIRPRSILFYTIYLSRQVLKSTPW